MIANSAVLAAIVLLLLTFELLQELAFLGPYRRVILHDYLWIILGSLVVVFLNLFACFYVLTRRLFLKDTGRKLAHVENSLTLETSCAISPSAWPKTSEPCHDSHDDTRRARDTRDSLPSDHSL